jgi:hypothetical protein
MVFGEKLREELIKIYHRPKLVQSRVKSADSQRLSMDSVNGGEVLLGDSLHGEGDIRRDDVFSEYVNEL